MVIKTHCVEKGEICSTRKNTMSCPFDQVTHHLRSHDQLDKLLRCIRLFYYVCLHPTTKYVNSRI